MRLGRRNNIQRLRPGIFRPPIPRSNARAIKKIAYTYPELWYILDRDAYGILPRRSNLRVADSSDLHVHGPLRSYINLFLPHANSVRFCSETVRVKVHPLRRETVDAIIRDIYEYAPRLPSVTPLSFSEIKLVCIIILPTNGNRCHI